MQAKPWYLSPGVWGIIFSVLGGVGPLHAWLAAHGLPNLFSDANLNAWVSAIGSIVSAGGALVALYHQVKNPTIITATAAKARALNRGLVHGA